MLEWRLGKQRWLVGSPGQRVGAWPSPTSFAAKPGA